jgi:serine/threonine protein kinase
MSSDNSTQEGTGPTRIGKYEVLAHIASGGMGSVYRAYDQENRREVALKVMSSEMAAKPAMLERFRREARSGLQLQHENVVTHYEYGESDGTCFLAMEFIDGIDLHEYIDKEGALDPEETRQIVLQAARALGHAHKQGIVHRDIKPSNFLLSRQDGRLRVKLSDLGLARHAAAEECRITRSGTTVGTVDYISPEQARDSGRADIRSDLYSLGCTWYHMLAGQPPFPDGGLAERLLKHLTTEPPDLRRFNPRISKELVAVVRKLLAKKPEDRYQSPRDLIQDLVSLNPISKPVVRKGIANGNLTIGKSRARRGGKKRSRTSRLRRHKMSWLIGGLLGLALLAGVVFWLGSRHKPISEPVPQPPTAAPIHTAVMSEKGTGLLNGGTVGLPQH